MKSSQFDGYTLLSWDSLDRLGFKAGTVTGMNTALHAPAEVNSKEILLNREMVSRSLGVEASLWTCADQIHGCASALLSGEDRGKGALSASSAVGKTDALILTDSPLGALIFTADCLPLVLVDTRQKKGAVIHAGWRGIASGIVPSVLERMVNELGSDPDHIWAAAGPAIDSCCYQIDWPVFDAVTRAYPETGPAFVPDGRDHWRFSLEQAVFLQLSRRGISRDRMEGSGLCSACTENLFSWRKDGPSSGRMGTFLVL